MHIHKHQGGFTLFELALVMTIVALLAGGIFVGKSLIRTARLQAVISDVNRYKNALKLFDEKYHSMPGDLSNATSLWGTSAYCPNNVYETPQKATCNGNGDGYITDSSGTPYSFAGQDQESLHAWQHLANAGLIEGQYTGSMASNNGYKPGLNIPASKWNYSGFTISYGSSPLGDPYLFNANYRHVIVFGTIYGLGTDTHASNPVLFGNDALSLDQKIDDGRPGTGNVMTYTPNLESNEHCASTAVATTAVYVLNQIKPNCALIFITGY